MDRIGFIGLGLMGKPMALNLLKKGFPLTVHSRSQAPVDALVSAGAAAAASPAAVAAVDRRHHHDGPRLAGRAPGARRTSTACSRRCARAASSST